MAELHEGSLNFRLASFGSPVQLFGMAEKEIRRAIDEVFNLWQSESSKDGDGAALAGPDAERDPSLPFDYLNIADNEEEAGLGSTEPERHPLIVAEGDSWFDYPIKGDLLDALRKKHGYTIYQVSKAGALLEDMAYGVSSKFWGNQVPQIVQTMEMVSKYQPSLVLISGGGNDIAGPEFAAYVNRKAKGIDPLREEVVDHMVSTVMRRAYQVFIGAMERVATEGGFSLKILGHNYDFPNPDGRGYSVTNFIPGFSYVGPWLKPTLDLKGYSSAEGRQILKRILLKFSDLQDQLAQSNAVFETVSFQGLLSPTSKRDWDNEMHPTWNGFKKIASVMDEKIQAL